MRHLVMTDSYSEPLDVMIDYRASRDDMYTPDAIIASKYTGIVAVEIAIHTDGRITIRSVQLSTEENRYYHAAESCNPTSATEPQKDAIAALWANRVPTLRTHATGSRLDGWVGATLCHYVPDLIERAERLAGKKIALA